LKNKAPGNHTGAFVFPRGGFGQRPGHRRRHTTSPERLFPITKSKDKTRPRVGDPLGDARRDDDIATGLLALAKLQDEQRDRVHPLSIAEVASAGPSARGQATRRAATRSREPRPWSAAAGDAWAKCRDSSACG